MSAYGTGGKELLILREFLYHCAKSVSTPVVDCVLGKVLRLCPTLGGIAERPSRPPPTFFGPLPS